MSDPISSDGINKPTRRQTTRQAWGPPRHIPLPPLPAGPPRRYIPYMLNALKNLLAGDSAAPLPEPDARLALAALLVRIARSDDEYARTEAEQIDRVMVRRYGLTPFEATALRAEAEAVEAEAPDTVRFTRAIKDGVPYEDRLGVIEALWSVVLADGHRDHEESALLRLVADLLGVNDRDSNLARLRVENGG